MEPSLNLEVSVSTVIPDATAGFSLDKIKLTNKCIPSRDRFAVLLEVIMVFVLSMNPAPVL